MSPLLLNILLVGQNGFVLKRIAPFNKSTNALIAWRKSTATDGVKSKTFLIAWRKSTAAKGKTFLSAFKLPFYEPFSPLPLFSLL